MFEKYLYKLRFTATQGADSGCWTIWQMYFMPFLKSPLSPAVKFTGFFIVAFMSEFTQGLTFYFLLFCGGSSWWLTEVGLQWIGQGKETTSGPLWCI